MQSGRLNYVYRLNAARLVILRLRFARRWKYLFQSRNPFIRANAFRGLIGMVILISSSGSAWLGYRAGQQTEVGSMAHTDPVPVAATSQLSSQAPAHAQPAERMPTHASVAVSAPAMPAVPEPERVDQQAEAIRIAEIVNLRETVGALRSQVQALEQEATGLELELLDQQIAFAREEGRWHEESVDRRIVYNITNIPVGGSISEELIGSDVQWAEIPEPDNEIDARWAESPAPDIENNAPWAEFPPPDNDNDFNDQNNSVDGDFDPYDQYREVDGPVEVWNGDVYLVDMLDQQASGMAAGEADSVEGEYDEQIEWQGDDYSYPEPALASELPVEQQIHQKIIFGPPPEQYEDWANP